MSNSPGSTAALSAANPPAGADEVRLAAAPTRMSSFMLLAVMLLTVYLAVANVFIVNVATPAIQRGLSADFSGVQFVMTSYTLAYAVSLIIGGRLGDRFGRKRLLLIGVAGFTAASFLCGLAGSVPVLVAVRILQGVSAALMMPQALSLIQTNYPPEKRAGVFGLYGAAQGIAATSGQLVGGFLLDWNPAGLDWRNVFFFSVPVGLLILVMASRIGESKGAAAAKLDWLGAAWASAGLLMLIYPLIQGQKEHWPAWLVALLVLSLPALALFVRYERRLSRTGGDPLVNVGLFRQRPFAVGMLLFIVLLLSQSAYFLASAYFLQFGLGFTALHAGLVILPMGIGYFLASLFSAKAVAKLGPHVLTAGALLTTAGYVTLALSVRATGADAAGYEWIPALAVLGVGQGALAAPLTTVILSRVERRDAGAASGILTTGMQVAFAIGIALVGIVLAGALERHAGEAAGMAAPRLQAALAEQGVGGAEAEAAGRQFPACYADYARAGDKAAVPPRCAEGVGLADDAAGSLLPAALREANAWNYAFAFEYCLYALAAFTLLLLPLVLVLIGGRRGAESASR